MGTILTRELATEQQGPRLRKDPRAQTRHGSNRDMILE